MMVESLNSSASFFTFHTRLQRSALMHDFFSFQIAHDIKKVYSVCYNSFLDAISEYTEEPRKTLLNDAGPRGGRNFFFFFITIFPFHQNMLFDLLLMVRLILLISLSIFSAPGPRGPPSYGMLWYFVA